VLEHYGIEPDDTTSVDILTVRPTLEGFHFLSVARLRGLKPRVRTIDLPHYSSLPTTLILPDAAWWPLVARRRPTPLS
jgi:hypothetical protein